MVSVCFLRSSFSWAQPSIQHLSRVDPHFYYYAPGCSDLYVRLQPRQTLVAKNKIDAAVQLLALRHSIMSNHLAEELAHRKLARSLRRSSSGHEPNAITACNVSGASLIHQSRLLDACDDVESDSQASLAARGGDVVATSRLHLWRLRTCLLRWHRAEYWAERVIIELMAALNVTTVILRFAFPGTPLARISQWKTEVMRLRPFALDTFYTPSQNATGGELSPCQPELSATRRCAYCRHGTLSTRSCLGSGPVRERE